MKQNQQQVHFQLPTEACWSHTWRQPVFHFMESDHFNGVRFFNQQRAPQGWKRSDLFKWLISRKSYTWNVDINQEHSEFHASKRSLPQNRPNAALDDWQVWFVGHATVLIQIGPYNLLTDPVWADYAGPARGKGPVRVCPAGIALEELPEIHAVLLSHNHYDHMDIASLKWLHEKFAMPVYTGLGNGWYLPAYMNVIEMEWWQSALFKELKIVYTPAQHSSGRGIRDQNRALWGSFSILHGTDHCYFAGDTGYGPHFREIHQRYGAPRIALLPIGAYEPRALMKYLHMNPEDAFQAHKDLHSKCSMAIHYRTFQLTDESREQPELDLHKAMKNSSKLMNPFYCVKEGRRLVV
ncbi:Zn-dependent hydrolase [Acinetobacter chinensis]|jgi:L-ascorbate metabolism protein UlaG (beta-lactamase superfamily)|uniref:Zn-dependent hydrolase n=1 Tax=Acinetobacter chinensis TaxID=2004650 RepID=A0A3B7LSK7_9GAMM|nr:MBL fold metallo-hydrolase [Acinetobacter chinensis]AXY55656.1 Zn-dependent hydrolase [Acinetobacter chinensis]WOE41982.1 MBL fold metallo-hydrolase [Acinetobacter chinensis]